MTGQRRSRRAGPAPDAAARPQVTVVVVGYNDAARLPRAVRSVLRQTLRDIEILIVDDASTDATPEVAQRLARHPSVRYVRLPENSGSAGRPRNVAVDQVRTPYVLFLDSDDELTPGACAVLLEAMQEDAPDLVSGQCVRVHVNKGHRITPWYQWVYARRATYDSVLEIPDLLYDTNSTNKLYRVEFLRRAGLRFPEGYHYEDLFFTAKAYAAASRITIVPDVVYRWYVAERPDVPSVTNRRSELRNFEDRLRIMRMIDAEFAARGAHQLKLHKDVKFLKHDLRLYLSDLPYRDEVFTSRFLELARDYLRTLEPGAFDRAEPVQAIAAWLILQGDERNLLSAIDYTTHGGKLSADLVEREGRIYWCAEHLDTPDGRRMLDVTGLGFQDMPLDRLDLYNRLTRVEIAGSRLSLSGEITNQLGRVRPDAPLRLELMMLPRRKVGSGRTSAVPDLRHDGDRIRWSAEVDLRDAVRALGFVDRVWDVRARLTVGAEVNVSRLSTRDSAVDGLAVAVRPLLGRIAADHLETLVTPDGDLALQFIPGSAVAQAVHHAGQRALASSAYRARTVSGRVASAAGKVSRPRLHEAASRTLLWLPADPALVVFESEGGRRCTGNPKAVYDEVRRRDLPLAAVWAYAGSAAGFPTDARLVRHGSLAYFRALARAAVWVDDGGFPQEAAKRAGTRYLQTGAGTIVEAPGLDPSSSHRSVRSLADRWDTIVVRSPYDEAVLAREFHLRAELLRTGGPRNDPLVRGDEVRARGVRQRWGVEPAAPIVLHVPSCPRALFAPKPADLSAGQVLVRWAADPGSTRFRDEPAVVDATAEHDLTGLLLAADVLVTDHHSCAFDFPLTGRPVVLIGCRCGVRVSGRGREGYLDLDADAPGPTVWEPGALAGELADLEGLRVRHAADLERVVKQFGSYDKGTAARDVVDAVFGRYR